MNALTPQKAAATVPATTEEDAFHRFLMEAASNPKVDVDKFERFIAMKRELERERAETSFNVAMSGAQQEMQPVRAECDNTQTRSKYASYAALDTAVRPIYTRHGFALSFNTGDGAAENCVRVLCDASNGSYTKQYRLDMPADGKGAKGGDVMTKTHATMSAITYGKRGLLGMIFNLAVSQRGDDDGNAAGLVFITQDQVDALRERADGLGADVRELCKFLRVEGLAKIPARRHGDAVAALDNYQRVARERAQGRRR